MNDQQTMFDQGDALGEELAYQTEDGARVRAPSLFQQVERPPTAAEAEASAAAAAFLAEHRALQIDMTAGNPPA